MQTQPKLSGPPNFPSKKGHKHVANPPMFE